MVAVPAPTIVTRPEALTVATELLLLVYVNSPKLLEVGYEGGKGASPTFLFGIVKVLLLLLLKVGAIGIITKLAGIDASAYPFSAGRDALIVVVPALRSVTTPDVNPTVAIVVSSIVYEKLVKLGLLHVGGCNVKVPLETKFKLKGPKLLNTIGVATKLVTSEAVSDTAETKPLYWIESVFKHCNPGVANSERISVFVISILLGGPILKEDIVRESLNVCVTVLAGTPDVTFRETAVIDCDSEDIDIL
jgi:hypothetical protein